MLYIFGTARLGGWRLNHIHSMNGTEVINASCSDSSAEIDYSISHTASLHVVTCSYLQLPVLTDHRWSIKKPVPMGVVSVLDSTEIAFLAAHPIV